MARQGPACCFWYHPHQKNSFLLLGWMACTCICLLRAKHTVAWSFQKSNRVAVREFQGQFLRSWRGWGTNDRYITQRYTTNINAEVVGLHKTTNPNTTATFYGKVLPFSNWADHIQVDTRDLPLTVEDVIERACTPHIQLRSINDIGTVLSSKGTFFAPTVTPLTARQLVQLGSVWYFPAPNDKGGPSLEEIQQSIRSGQKIYKTRRLSEADLEEITVQANDYFRVHHTPRRFPSVYDYQWNESQVVLANDDEQGFMVINKPSLVPVHSTVDNHLETVLHQLRENRQSNPPKVQSSDDDEEEDNDYFATTQRLDINTSGLLVVATRKDFAAHFAKLLRNKTSTVLTSNATASSKSRDPITKSYKCLVAVTQTNVSSVMEQLYGHVEEQQVIRHWQQKSIRAPKYFTDAPPSNTSPESPNSTDTSQNQDTWYECLLKLTKVGNFIPLSNTDESSSTRQKLKHLWPNPRVAKPPSNLQGVVEVQVQLLTGRTHQIRGQLACLGLPIVGDEQYGGAETVPVQAEQEAGSDHESTLSSEQRLALQCCHLEFLDTKNEAQSFDLDQAWWSNFDKTTAEDEMDVNMKPTPTSEMEQELLESIAERTQTTDEDTQETSEFTCRPDLLPPPVQLSPGRNKYVIVRVRNPLAKQNPDLPSSLWFVRSASPGECGGPYHANVAEDLVEWIQSAGYADVQVMGGGRIHYREASSSASNDYFPPKVTIYGYSLGFGRGDHDRVAALVRSTWSDRIENEGLEVVVDWDPKLY